MTDCVIYSRYIMKRLTTAFILCATILVLILSIHPNITLIASGQDEEMLFQKEVQAVDNMSALKIKVDDVDIAYKQLGNNTLNPIVLIAGGSMTMDMWNPTLLRELSVNRSIIIFDNRGVGESSLGTKKFSIKQFADDASNMLHALNIEKADVLGFSMGSFVAQELTLKNPDQVRNLILYGSSCGGKEAVPPGPQTWQTLDVFTKEGNTTRIERDKFTSTMFPPEWLKENPNYENYIPFPNDTIAPEISQRQIEAILNWWSTGTCNSLQDISQPTLVIVGTADAWTPSGNSLMIAQEIRGAWLVQIKDAGHGLMNQYPDKFSSIMLAFLQNQS
jgi:pimeloyl-ACP methyl ester carboxylesterase